jgi:hypothetical protein
MPDQKWATLCNHYVSYYHFEPVRLRASEE